MYPTWNVMRSPSAHLLKISATETPVTFCRTRAAMLSLCYIPRTSPSNFSTESQFFLPQYVFYEKPQKIVAACDDSCDVMETYGDN